MSLWEENDKKYKDNIEKYKEFDKYVIEKSIELIKIRDGVAYFWHILYIIFLIRICQEQKGKNQKLIFTMLWAEH